MLLKKYANKRRKFKFILLCIIIALIVATLVIFKQQAYATAPRERVLDARFIEAAVEAAAAEAEAENEEAPKVPQAPVVVVVEQSQQERVPIVPEKYDEHKIRTRIANEKIKHLKEQQQQLVKDPDEEHTTLDGVSTGIHIFYSAPVQWYKAKKSLAAHKAPAHEPVSSAVYSSPKNPLTLNSAFYPALGPYRPTTSLLQRHFENIRRCGVAVLILSLTNRPGEFALYEEILHLVPAYNLSVTFELSLSGNQSRAYVRQQLTNIRKYADMEGFYRVHSLSRNMPLPVLYVSNAYKLTDAAERLFCASHMDNERRTLDALFIGHIRLKSHADSMRRLCFDGFYSKLPSNGATYASTWKNWSYLKSFAQTYKMLFVPTVGPGFAERNKFPRHGDIQRHRSNGRYYGVAWRTALINHVGFISIASYNNWQDGSQIEEVIPKAGFLDYSPGSKTKYLDLTTHWVGNFMKMRRDASNVATLGKLNCYELLNNTIC